MVIFLPLLKKELTSVRAEPLYLRVCCGLDFCVPSRRQIVDVPDNPAACGQMLEATFSAVTHSVMIFTIQESLASTLVCSSKSDETVASLMMSKSVGNMYVFSISRVI